MANSVKIHADQRDGLSKIREELRDGSSKIREGQRDLLRTIRADREDGFVQGPKRKTSSRSTKFDILNVMERGLGVEEVNAVDAVQEIVEITIDSGAAKSAWPIREKGVGRTKGDENGKETRDGNSYGRVTRAT